MEVKVNSTNESKPLNKIVELSLLYDFYGNLLKEQKRKIFEDYILNDLSLGEISSQYGISRQGVYDIVKRCQNELYKYESKLCLIRKFRHVEEKVQKIQQAVRRLERPDDSTEIAMIEKLASQILDEL